jgi:hypothetical protein
MQPNPNSPGYSLTAKELPELLLRIICSEVSVHHLAEVLRLSPAHDMGVYRYALVDPPQAGEYPTISQSRHRGRLKYKQS